MQRFQVIIVGGGPVGSVAAYRLAQRGIDVLLIEAEDSCREDLRASTFHPPTLDMMEELGILDDLDAVGLRAPVYQYRNRQSGAVISLDMGELSDVLRHPYRLQCEQYKLSRLLNGLLQEHPHAKALFSRRVVHLAQDSAGVDVTVETPFAIETYRADYVIGADGANSIVRKWLGIEFDGFTYPERFLTLSTRAPLEEYFENLANVNYVADPKEWCVLLKVPSVWRVLVPSAIDEDDAFLLSDEKKDSVFGGLLGPEAHIETDHRTLYRVHQRVAKTYRQGRIILAGDAAHLNNPLGGFGMNSGIHDAWMLTDQLSAILQDGAEADPLLDAYDYERRKVMHDFIQKQSIRNKSQMEDNSAERQAKNQAEMEAIFANPASRRAYLLSQAMIPAQEQRNAA